MEFLIIFERAKIKKNMLFFFFFVTFFVNIRK